jgi:hypothetical protein
MAVLKVVQSAENLGHLKAKKLVEKMAALLVARKAETKAGLLAGLKVVQWAENSVGMMAGLLAGLMVVQKVYY